jgi:predicted alpha-1,2-mannosidase
MSPHPSYNNLPKRILVLTVLLLTGAMACQSKPVKNKSVRPSASKPLTTSPTKEQQTVSQRKKPADYVNPFVGTGGHGHTFPGATRPFAMVQLSPDTRLEGWDGCSGYHDSDRVIYGFSHTHLSGTGVSDYGDILLMPSTGPLQLKNGFKESPKNGYCSRFLKAKEQASPGYYKVTLEDSKIDVELTSTDRVGFHKYTFPKTDQAHIIIDLDHRDPLISQSLEFLDSKTLVGVRQSKAWASDQIVYFVAEFSKAFESYGFERETPQKTGVLKTAIHKKAYVNFSTKAGEVVFVKVALSAVSIKGARKNMAIELPHWNFDRVRAQSTQVWNKALGKIVIEGKQEEQKRVFYTALYHSMIAPNLFSDQDGQYRGMDRKIHNAKDGPQYTVFSLWDTFRATHPLLTLIEQKRTTDFIKTFLRQYKDGGQLPIWELSGNYTGCMIGYHSIPVILDAYIKGLRDYDARLALKAMVHSANQDKLGLKDYRRRGYIDSGDEAESVSKTLEYAYDDWCIAQLAWRLGEKILYKTFMERSQSYKNLYDPQSGFFRAKVNGAWQSPFDPREVNFHFTEANAWQYSLFVPHDIYGLMALKGGKKAFEAHLDALFAAKNKTTGRHQVDITGLIGQYAHGNEPSHHMAYLYNYVGNGAKTQKRVHQIMRELYSDKPDGLSGNEDCGQMSSWYVLSALGIYPVTPGSQQYVFGSPLFEKATLNLESGRQFQFEARACSAKNIYIQSVQLNGQPYNKTFINHETLLKGGSLTFEMGPNANNKWIRVLPGHIMKQHRTTSVPYFKSSQGQSFKKSCVLEIKSAQTVKAIYYTLHGATPSTESSLYKAPFILKENTVVKAFALSKSGLRSPVVEGRFYKVREDRSIEIHSKYANQYAAGGNRALIDSLKGGANFRTGRWQGYQDDVEATVDLGKVQPIKTISVGFLQDIQSWIWLPKSLEIQVSNDGESFRSLGVLSHKIPDNQYGSLTKELVSKKSDKARYVRIKALNYGRCPKWHLGAGGQTWVFIDEISIE